jgi:hypothetical protein
MSAEDCVSVQSRCVLLRLVGLAGSSQFQVFDGIYGVSRKRAAKLGGNVDVGRSRHSKVNFVKQDQVREAQDGMVVKQMDNPWEPSSIFDVPLDDSHEGAKPRRRAIAHVDARLPEKRPQFRLMVPIEFRAACLSDRVELAEPTCQVLVVLAGS